MIIECPHCGVDRIGFSLGAQMHESASLLKQEQPKFRVNLTCNGCEEIVIGLFVKVDARSRVTSPNECPGDPRNFGWALLKSYPTPAPSRCPEHTPDNLKRLFLQAADANKRDAPDASGAMSRKVIDNSTQLLLKDEAKKYGTIYARIEALKNKGTLTPELAAWAHEVRLGGNDAAHDLEPFTPEEAGELLDFAELYLIYVYTLPERLKLRRAKAAEEKAKQSGDATK